MLDPQVIEVVIGAPEAQDGEILGSLEDPGDRHTRGGGIVNRGRRGAPGEALQLEIAARVEHVEGAGHREVGSLNSSVRADGNSYTRASGPEYIQRHSGH